MSLEAWLPLQVLSIYLSPGSGAANGQHDCGADQDPEADFSVDSESEPDTPADEELETYYARVREALEEIPIEGAAAVRRDPYDDF